MIRQEEKRREAIEGFEHEILNIMGNGPEVFIEYMLHNHRTLQQNFTRVCYNWLMALADQPSDLRNEASVEFAKRVKVEVGDQIPFPFI